MAGDIGLLDPAPPCTERGLTQLGVLCPSRVSLPCQRSIAAGLPSAVTPRARGFRLSEARHSRRGRVNARTVPAPRGACLLHDEELPSILPECG